MTVAAVAVTLIGWAGPAAAVTPRPTDYRSTVTSVEPGAPITVEVVGADTLLALQAEPGHEVVVAGYGGEPYLRVQRDGTTQVNERSPAVSLNRTRDADISGSNLTSVTDAPDWTTTGHAGHLLWHDHRIHVQDAADFEGAVAWSVPVTVDGEPVVIHGRLERIDPPSPIPFLLAAAAVAAAAWLIGRHHPRPTAAGALLVGSGLALATGFVEWASLPTEVARNPGLFLLPVGAGAAAVGGLVVRRRLPALLALLGSVALLAGWLAFRWATITRSVLVTDLAPTVDRLGYSVVLGLTVAAAGLTVEWAGTPDTQAPDGRTTAGSGPGVRPATG